MNAAGSDMWKPGEKHPEFLQESEKLVVLQPLFVDTTAVVQVNESAEGTVVTDNTPIVLTGEDVYYRVGENGNWTKISNEPLVLGANKVATIYYASAEELQSIKWYDPNVNEFVLTTAGQLTYLAQLVNGEQTLRGKRSGWAATLKFLKHGQHRLERNLNRLKAHLMAKVMLSV